MYHMYCNVRMCAGFSFKTFINHYMFRLVISDDLLGVNSEKIIHIYVSTNLFHHDIDTI